MASVAEALEKRCSTRGFEKTECTQEQIDKLLTAGLQSPTATNRQEIFFTVVKGDDPRMEEVEQEKCVQRGIKRGEHNSWYEAPLLILLSADADFHWSELDAGIAVQSMALMAEELGLGSLIIGSIYDALHGEKSAYFKEKLCIPAGKDFCIALAVGIKAVEKAPHTYERDKQVVVL